jgi:hypothetical protein
MALLRATGIAPGQWHPRRWQRGIDTGRQGRAHGQRHPCPGNAAPTAGGGTESAGSGLRAWATRHHHPAMPREQGQRRSAGWQRLPNAAETVRQARRRESGREPARAAAIQLQNPTEQPGKSKRFPAPPVHTASRRIRREIYAIHSRFVAAFREAAEHLRAHKFLPSLPVRRPAVWPQRSGGQTVPVGARSGNGNDRSDLRSNSRARPWELGH